MVDATTESIVALDQALGVWSQRSAGLFVQAAAHLRNAVGAIEGELRERVNRVRALEAMRAASASSEEELARIEAELAVARELLQRAERARAVAFGAAERFEAARRRAGFAMEPAVQGARGDLKRRLSHLDAYAVRGVAGPAGSAGSATADPVPAAVSSFGLQMVPLSSVDFSDNPLIGRFGQGGAELADYRWAVETWDTVVGPGLARNLDRDAFAARDAERGAPAFRRTADVYDLFLGNSPIVLSPRPDGSYNVIVGRHRIHAARQLGITSLPARVLP